MAIAQSQFLKIYDAAGVVYARWQNYYGNTVAWDGQSWQNISFSADGATEAAGSQESEVTVTAIATTLTVQIIERSILTGRFAELTVYHFDPAYGNSVPQSEQQLVTQYAGQIIGGGGGLTNITMKIGPPVALANLTVPNRKFTSAIMGQGCRL